MQFGDLKRQLHHWGRVFGVGVAVDGDDEVQDRASVHPLVSGAPSTRYDRQTRRRAPKYRTYRDVDGKLKRELAPKIVCYGAKSKNGIKPMAIPAAAEAVELAVIDLYRSNATQAVILRMEYCNGSIDRTLKVNLANEVLGTQLSARSYRTELELAHSWLLGLFAGRSQIVG